MTEIRSYQFTRQGVEYEFRMYPKSHQYKIKGGQYEGFTRLPSVTTVAKPSSGFNAPRAIAWLKKHVRGALEEMVGTRLTEVGISDAINAADRYRDAASDSGSTIHDWAERYFQAQLDDNGETVPPPPQYMIACEAIKDWAELWKIRPVAVEKILVNLEKGYAGMADLFAYYVDPETGDEGLGIFDFKTGKGAYQENFVQLSAYVDAVQDMGELPELDSEKRFILHIPLHATEVTVLRPKQSHETDLMVFDAAHFIYAWQKVT